SWVQGLLLPRKATLRNPNLPAPHTSAPYRNLVARRYQGRGLVSLLTVTGHRYAYANGFGFGNGPRHRLGPTSDDDLTRSTQSAQLKSHATHKPQPRLDTRPDCSKSRHVTSLLFTYPPPARFAAAEPR
ncbi:hypothetical protein FDECE_17472, partial [Fusarium decemcellulare]